jgi:hypothetical protein
MKKEIAEKWAEALESGKYKQGRHYLRVGDEFCCLGVLCEIAIESGVGVSSQTTMDGEVYRYEETTKQLPRSVQVWAGVRTAIGSVNGGYCLAEYNDSGKTFNQIADIIRQNVEVL